METGRLWADLTPIISRFTHATGGLPFVQGFLQNVLAFSTDGVGHEAHVAGFIFGGLFYVGWKFFTSWKRRRQATSDYGTRRYYLLSQNIRSLGRSHTTLVRLNPSECTLSWGRRRVSCCLRATTRTLRIKSVISGRGDIARFECYEPDDGRCLVVTGVEKYIAGHRNLYIQLIAPSQRLRDNWVNHLSRYLEQFKGKRTSSYKKW
eukprot:801835_1